MTSKPLAEMLKDPSLLVTSAYVGGSWMKAAPSGKTFNVLNPSTGEVITALPDLGVDETKTIIKKEKVQNLKSIADAHILSLEENE